MGHNFAGYLADTICMNLPVSSPPRPSQPSRRVSKILGAGKTWWLVTVVFAILCVASLPNALSVFRLGDRGLAACVVDLGFPCKAPASTSPGLEVLVIFLALFIFMLVAAGIAAWRSFASAEK